MINPRVLYFLSAISRRGSLRRAASLVGVDVSSVSRQIRQVEETLEIKLLERGPKGTNLTEAGRLLVDHYHNQLAAEEAALSRLTELQGVVTGRVRMAVGEGFIADLISEPMRRFMYEHPRVDLEVIMSGTVDATGLIKAGDVDLALLYAPPVDRQLRCHAETRQPLDLIVPADHLLAQSKKPVSIQEIARWPMAQLDHSFGIRQMVNAVAHHERVLFDAHLYTNSIAVLTNFVSAGIGIAFMPELTVTEEVKKGKIAVIPMDHSILNGARAQIVSLASRETTIATQSCLTHLKNGMRFFTADAPRLITKNR